MFMTGYEAYELFQALKRHFTQEKFDFFKYRGHINTSKEAFENRKDKWHFYKLSRKFGTKQELTDFLIANFLDNENIWVNNLLVEEADIRYIEYKKVMQSLAYTFENDCISLFEDCKEPNSLLVTNGDYPILLTKALRKEIHIQTLVLLNIILGFVPMWSKTITDTIRWPNYHMKMLKIASFLPQDSVRYKLILKKVLV
jgi:hypothetical protein